MHDSIAVALVAAVPATIAAIGVWKSRKHTQTTNGSTLGQLAEAIHLNMRQLVERFDNHINDAEIHYAEAHASVQGLCPTCALHLDPQEG